MFGRWPRCERTGGASVGRGDTPPPGPTIPANAVYDNNGDPVRDSENLVMVFNDVGT